MLAHSLIAPDSRDGTETLGRALRHEGNGGNGGNGGNDRHGGNGRHGRNEGHGGNEGLCRNEGNEGHGGNGGNGGNEGNVGRKGTSGDVVRSFILRAAEGQRREPLDIRGAVHLILTRARAQQCYRESTAYLSLNYPLYFLPINFQVARLAN